MYNPSGSDNHTIRSFTLPGIKKCCWVPNCLNIENTNCFKTFYPLPTDAILREIWLARVGKPIVSSVESIYLCEEHFKHNDLIDHISKGTTLIPYYKMSQVICRLCMSIVPEEQPYHVLSNNIPTVIPPDLKNTLKLAIVITPEPLQHIVKFCMPELIIQAEPIPLICQNCFKNLWKLFLFKSTCLEVDKRLRGDLSIETYGKMVLCRACPRTFGTNFIVLVEQSNLGMFLMNMFSTKYSSKVVPLRLCTNCYEILEELLEFQLNCDAVEKKMKCHMALTQNQEIVGAQVISSLKPVNSTIWKTKDSSTNKKSPIEVVTNENSTNTNSFVTWNKIEFVKAMIKHGQPLKNKVDKIEKDEIWRNINQELQAKGIVCNVLGLKNTWVTMMADIQKAITKKQRLNELQSLMIKYLKTDQHAGPVSSVQHQPLINNNIYESRTIGITPYLENTKYSFDFHLCQQTQCPSIIQENSFNLYEQEMCRGAKIQLQILEENTSLDNNISTETNANLETCPNFETFPNFETVPNKESLVNSSMGTSDTRSFLSNTQDNNRSENCLIAPVSAKSRTANRLSNILKPDINKKNISVHDRVDIPMNITAITDISGSNTRNQEIETGEITFSNEQQLELLEMMKTEYMLYLKEFGNVYSNLPFKTLIARIIKHHKNYQNYSLNTIYNYWRTMEENSLQNKNNVIKTGLQQGILEFLEFESQHRQTKVHPKQRNKLIGYKKRKYKRSEEIYQDKMDFVEAAQREYNALTNEEKNVRSIWKTLAGKIHKRGFKNWSSTKIYSLWSRLKISALVHEKNSDDLVDREVWKLIQQFNSDKKCIQNNKHISENHKDTITMDTSEKPDIGLNVDKNRSDTVTTPIEHAQEVRDNPTFKKTVKLDKRMFNTGRRSNKKLVFLLTLSEKVDFLNKIDQEFNNNPEPWTNILSRLYRSRYKNWDKTKIFGVWNQLKVAYITHENKKSGDIADKKMWDLLQKSAQPQKNKTNSKKSSTSGCSTVKCGKDNLKEKSIHADQKNADSTKSQKLSEAEKLILFKNIKKEYLAMVNSKKQNMSRPWKIVTKRVHEKYYKNILTEKKVLFEWTKMRKSATLHENTSSMTEIDWKVVRILKLAKKVKDCNKNSNKKETCHTEPKRKIIQDDEIDNNSNNREELEEPKKDYVEWCYKKKLDLITTVKSYGREVFKKCDENEKYEFWLKIKRDFQKRGYKYSGESLRRYWEELQESANMAWADQKVASELDDVIINFMKSVIKLKQGSGMCEKNKNIIKEPPMAEKLENNELIRSVDKEQSINEASEEGSNAASEEGSNEANEEGSNEANEEGSNEASEEGSDEDNEMLEEINDKYVSLEDIRNYMPVVLNDEIVELSSDDETVVDFASITEDVKNVGVMIEKSKITVEKEEIKKLKLLMENVGVVQDFQQERNISENLLNIKSHKAEMVQSNMVEDCSVIVIDSDDE